MGTGPLAIKKIHLKNYRCYRRPELDGSQSVDPAPLTLVTGPTGSGKSTIVEAVRFVLSAAVQPANGAKPKAILEDRAGMKKQPGDILALLNYETKDTTTHATLDFQGAKSFGVRISRKSKLDPKTGAETFPASSDAVGTPGIGGAVPEAWTFGLLTELSESQLSARLLEVLRVDPSRWTPAMVRARGVTDPPDACWPRDADPAAGIGAMIEWLRTRRNELAAERQSLLKANAGVIARLGELADQAKAAALPRDIAANYESIIKEWGAREAHQEQSAAVEESRQRLAGRIADLRAKLEGPEPAAVDLQRLANERQDLAENQARRDSLMAEYRAAASPRSESARPIIEAALGEHTADCPGCGLPMSAAEFLAGWTEAASQPFRTLDEIKREGEAVRGAIDDTANWIQAAESGIRIKAERDSARAQIAELEASLRSLPPPPSAADAARSKAAEIQAAAIRKEYELALAVKECEAQRLANNVRIETIASALDALAPQTDAAFAVREEMLRDSAGPFEAAANRLLALCTADQFAFSRSGVLTFGLYNPVSGLRPWRSLSGGESILCHIAFQAGLFATRREDMPLRCILAGDLDRISPPSAQLGLLRALAELVKDGTISQAIIEGAVWLHDDAEPEHYQRYVEAAREAVARIGFQIIDLSPKTERDELREMIAAEAGDGGGR